MAGSLAKVLGQTAIGLAAVVFTALGAASGSLYWNRVEQHGERSARTELSALAADEIPRVLGYEYQTVERSLTETYPLFTPGYRQEFQQHVTDEIIPQARDKHLVNQVDVVGVGILSVRRTAGSVLVFMNRTMTDKSKQTLYDGSRLRVDYRKIDNKWLIDNIAPI